MALKLAAVIATITPFLASDQSPEAVRRAIIAADKRGKDAAGSGLGARELEERDQPKAQDAAIDEREAACDEREETMDAAEAKADEGKEDKDAKDRKGARDKRAKDRGDRKMGRDKRAKDRKAHDRNDDPEHTNPGGGTDEDYMTGSDPSTPGGSRAGGKTTVDSAEVDRRILAAVNARDALHTARREVEPILGVVAMDSAGAVYRAALDKLGVDHKSVPDEGLAAMLKLARDRANASSPASPDIAADRARVSEIEKVIPGFGRLK